MHRVAATQRPVRSTNHPQWHANVDATDVACTENLAETLWQLRAGEHAVALTCHADVSGFVRVVGAPDLLHYMKGWLLEEVARYARRYGWRLAFVA